MAAPSTLSYALLLVPHQLKTDQHILRCMEINRNGITAQFQTADLDATSLKKRFPDLPKPAYEALSALTSRRLYDLEDELLKKHKLQQSGVPQAQFVQTAYTRQLHQLFEQAKPYFPLLKWYHQLPNPANGRPITAVCRFSNLKPSLHFRVVAEAALLGIEIEVQLNDTPFPITDFRRFAFLLESRNEYWMLSHKDYLTMEWLQQQDMADYTGDRTAFAANILNRLEADYPVDRNGLFEVAEISVQPRQRVLLSEISQAFLVLTPQWVYDGYLAEGPWKEGFEVLQGSTAYFVKRDQAAETAFKKQLEALHPNFPKQLNGWYHLSFAEAQKKQWFLKVYHQLLEWDIELVGMDMLQHFRYSPHKPVTETAIVEQNDKQLIINFILRYGDETISLSALQKVLLNGQRALMLREGSLGILPEDWLNSYATLVKHSKVLKQHQLQVPQWLALASTSTEETSLRVTVGEPWWNKWRQWQDTETPLYPVPANIAATLRPYQQKGYEWMKLLSEVQAGACLADDMGLGKTLQTICFIADRLAHTMEGVALIVCPSSLLYNWQRELAKFAPDLRCALYHGPSRNFNQLVFDTADVFITSYGTMRSDIHLLSTQNFAVVVIDESHNIKNPSAQITRAVNQLQAIHRVALSGTPVMNNTFDLYAQLEFLLPGMFGSREFFKREYADPIDRDRSAEKMFTLQRLTAPFILRRTKEQVAKDLPEKTESILWCSMGIQQKNLYDEVRNNIRSNLFTDMEANGLGKSKLAVLQGIMKLRQICSSPMLLPKEEQTTGESVKMEVLLEELVNMGNHKALVFSQFSSMLQLLATALQQQGIAHYLLDGSTPIAKRAEMVEQFQQPENETPVFLISLLAGNTGLTLTAADYVFLFDPWWNNAVQQQAIDRTHRIGQTKSVFAYKMICKDSIEEKIILLQQQKKELSDHLIGQEEGLVKQLSREDVDFLFS